MIGGWLPRWGRARYLALHSWYLWVAISNFGSVLRSFEISKDIQRVQNIQFLIRFCGPLRYVKIFREFKIFEFELGFVVL